jgi:hypothetical protein
MGHAEQCLAHARQHLRELTERVRNPSAIPGLMRAYLEQPAYSGLQQWVWERVMGPEHQKTRDLGF